MDDETSLSGKSPSQLNAECCFDNANSDDKEL